MKHFWDSQEFLIGGKSLFDCNTLERMFSVAAKPVNMTELHYIPAGMSAQCCITVQLEA